VAILTRQNDAFVCCNFADPRDCDAGNRFGDLRNVLAGNGEKQFVIVPAVER